MAMEKDKWLTSDEVMSRCGINKITLVENIKKNILPARSISGKWFIEKPLPLFSEGVIGSVRWTPSGITIGKRSDESKLLVIVNTSEKIQSQSFSNIVQNLNDLIFSIKNVIEFEASYPPPIEAKEPDKRSDLKKESMRDGERPGETFENLKFSYLNDSEFVILLPGKKITVTPAMLGCRDEKTNEWKELVRIIKDPDHIFHLKWGDKNYESRRKLRNGINKKVVNYLRKDLHVDIAVDYKICSRVVDGPGVFRFAFVKPKTEEDSHFADLTNNDLLNRIKRLNKFDRGDSQETDEYVALVSEAVKRKILEKEFIKCRAREQVSEEFNSEEWKSMSKKDLRIQTFGKQEEPQE
jgi:hypothetical protein